MELSPFSIYSLPIQSTSVRIPLKFFCYRSFYEGAKLYFFVTTYTFLKKKNTKKDKKKYLTLHLNLKKHKKMEKCMERWLQSYEKVCYIK